MEKKVPVYEIVFDETSEVTNIVFLKTEPIKEIKAGIITCWNPENLEPFYRYTINPQDKNE